MKVLIILSLFIVVFISFFGADAPKKMWDNATSEPKTLSIDFSELEGRNSDESSDESYGFFDFFWDAISFIFKGSILGVLIWGGEIIF